jgi:hypothetical protein
MDNKEFLPIGSVVKLKGAQKNLMVTGYLSIIPETREEFDYCGCLWPIGYLDSKTLTLFNKNAIEKVIHEGYSDAEQKEFSQKLIELSKEIEEKMKEEKNITKENVEKQ